VNALDETQADPSSPPDLLEPQQPEEQGRNVDLPEDPALTDPLSLPQTVEQPGAAAQDVNDEADVDLNRGDLEWRTALATSGAVALLSPMPLAGYLLMFGFAGGGPSCGVPEPLVVAGVLALRAASCGAPAFIPAAPALLAWLHDQPFEWQPVVAAAVGGLLTTAAIGVAGGAGVFLAGLFGLGGASEAALGVFVGTLVAVAIVWVVGSVGTGYAVWVTFPASTDSGDSSLDLGSRGRPSPPAQPSRARVPTGSRLLLEQATGSVAY
jgi:hypothetical protein